MYVRTLLCIDVDADVYRHIDADRGSRDRGADADTDVGIDLGVECRHARALYIQYWQGKGTQKHTSILADMQVL